MKPKIHPEYYNDAQVVCACGNTFTIGSTRKMMKVELCSKCHPFSPASRGWWIPWGGWSALSGAIRRWKVK